jgi:hypothetical protein
MRQAGGQCLITRLTFFSYPIPVMILILATRLCQVII